MSKNKFAKCSDEDIRECFVDYVVFNNEGIIPPDGKLKKMQEKYKTDYGSHAVQIMEKHLLMEIATRWMNLRWEI